MAKTRSVCAQFVLNLKREAKGNLWVWDRWVSEESGLSFRKVAVQDGLLFALEAFKRDGEP